MKTLVATVLETRPSELEDALSLANRLRPGDYDSFVATGSGDPLGIMEDGILSSSWTTTVTMRGIPIAIFGLRRLTELSQTASPWLLCGPEIEMFPRQAYRIACRALREMLGSCTRLVQVVDERDAGAIRFLRHLGFRFGEPIYLQTGFKVIPVSMEASDV